MRVTHQMIADRTTANLSTAITRLMDLQTQMSSARRLNRPSDDPIGVTRALSYRTTISTVTQYQNNIDSARTQMNAVEQSLGSVSSLLISARELATGLADDVFDATARKGAAAEARSLLDQMLQAGNTQLEGRYIFSGHMTRNQTLLATPNGVVYQGDQGVIYAQIEASSQIAVNMLGSDLFLGQIQTLGNGFDFNRGLSDSVLLSEINNGTGASLTPGLVNVTDDNTGVTVSVDLSAATTVGDVISAFNSQLTAGGITGVTASLSPSGESIRLDSVANGLVSASTRLENLNNGNAVDVVPGKFRVATDDGSTDVTVDISGTLTLGEVISSFNAQMAAAGVANVTMDVNPGQTGLRIRDTNTPPLGLKVEDLAGEFTAQNLGFGGYINDELIGGDLNPERAFSIAENGAGETTAADLGLLGSFTRTLDGGDLNPVLTTGTPLAELQNAKGISLGRIRISQGDTFRVVDLTTAVTVGDVIDRINASGLDVQAGINATAQGIQVLNTSTDKSLMIRDEDAIGGAAALGIKGSPDLMGNMMMLIDALENNDRDMIGRMVGSLEAATNKMLDGRSAVGANIRRMESTGYRLTELSLSVTQLLSEVEDADIIKVTTELATQQNMYQAALNAVSRILTPSLVDFIR